MGPGSLAAAESVGVESADVEAWLWPSMDFGVYSRSWILAFTDVVVLLYVYLLDNEMKNISLSCLLIPFITNVLDKEEISIKYFIRMQILQEYYSNLVDITFL